MIHNCSFMKVAEVFFNEPTTVHFIREVGRKTSLSPTSVRLHMKRLEKSGFIMKKESRPFTGYVADRDNERFIYYKRLHNISTLFDVRQKIIDAIHPKAIILFGSYFLGEDIEDSDIDIIVLSKASKEIDFQREEKYLHRKISVIKVENIEELERSVKRNVKKGLVIYGDMYE